ncbi:MAG: hypothetical protein NXH75_16355 [Halobacteriovoraceae bacterium]|nr:hypothetical protein [Halobacteriovoraceae bacterium]
MLNIKINYVTNQNSLEKPNTFHSLVNDFSRERSIMEFFKAENLKYSVWNIVMTITFMVISYFHLLNKVPFWLYFSSSILFTFLVTKTFRRYKEAINTENKVEGNSFAGAIGLVDLKICFYLLQSYGWLEKEKITFLLEKIKSEEAEHIKFINICVGIFLFIPSSVLTITLSNSLKGVNEINNEILLESLSLSIILLALCFFYRVITNDFLSKITIWKYIRLKSALEKIYLNL